MIYVIIYVLIFLFMYVMMYVRVCVSMSLCPDFCLNRISFFIWFTDFHYYVTTHVWSYLFFLEIVICIYVCCIHLLYSLVCLFVCLFVCLSLYLLIGVLFLFVALLCKQMTEIQKGQSLWRWVRDSDFHKPSLTVANCR